LGPEGLKNLAEDSKIPITDLNKFAKNGDIAPIAENIPILWSLIFEEKTPIQALNMLEENNM